MIKLLLVFILILSPFHKESEFEQQCVEQVNALRKMERTKPLVLDSKLSAKCEKYARRLARTRNFIHDPRLKNEDIGENIAMSSDPSVNPITIWKNSTGHRQNMVDRDFKKVGVALATNGNETYYVMRLK